MPRVRIPIFNLQNVRRQFPNYSSARVVLRQLLPEGGVDSFEFPFAPREVSFEDLAGDVVEIARAGRYPHTEYRAPKLQKIAFDFRIADRDTGGIKPVDEQLDKLRTIALRDGVVQISGLDNLITYSNPAQNIRYDAAWYRITNFALRSVQRTVDYQYVGSAHRIAIADCSMTLVENRNDQLPIITVPRLYYNIDFPVVSGGDPGGVPGTDDPRNNYA